jgi:bifunctional non-homologous end joining protein LigD
MVNRSRHATSRWPVSRLDLMGDTKRGMTPRDRPSPVLSIIPDELRKRVVEARQPDWTVPMTATLTDRRFSDPAWIFERKLDGERCLAFRHGERLRLMSRNRLNITPQYPDLAEALLSERADDFIVDGEIVAFEGNRTSFPKLQQRMHVSNPSPERIRSAPVFFYLFDVLHADGGDVTRLPLKWRKSILLKLLDFSRHGRVRFARHRNAQGERYYQEACGKGWEGIIAKRADAPYEHRRSKAWLKFKCTNEQEFVIGGYTDPQGSRTGFGALLLGYYEGGQLTYAGKVGTGFDTRSLGDLLGRMEPLVRGEPAFERGVLPRKGVHWIEPVLVAQVAFSEWTGDGQLRHPRYQGLRQDKDARDVVRERPQS